MTLPHSPLRLCSCPQTVRPSHIKETRMAKPDPYADIDFEEITDATGLAVDEIKCLKVCAFC